MGLVRFNRCSTCGAIAIRSRQDASGDIQYACEAHSKDDDWQRVCSVAECTARPVFQIEYRMGNMRSRMFSCPEHFHVIPEDISEVFRIV